MHYFGVTKCENYFTPNACILLHYTQNDVWEWFGAFADLRHVKSFKTFISSLNALFRVTEDATMVSLEMHPFETIRPKIMFVSASEHFKNVWQVKRCKTCGSGFMHNFGVQKL
jgi:hypothetical protein